MAKKVVMVCKHCGSENVNIEAVCTWDKELQDWKIETIYSDSERCADCENEGDDTIVEKEIDEDAPIEGLVSVETVVPDPAVNGAGSSRDGVDQYKQDVKRTYEGLFHEPFPETKK